MARQRMILDTSGKKLDRQQVIYLSDDVNIEELPRMYRGKPLVRVGAEELSRAYGILLTITDQHLRPQRQDQHRLPHAGISQHFHYDRGLDVYVYGPESLARLQNMKFRYDNPAPLVQLVSALHLPSPTSQIQTNIQSERLRGLLPAAV